MAKRRKPLATTIKYSRDILPLTTRRIHSIGLNGTEHKVQSLYCVQASNGNVLFSLASRTWTEPCLLARAHRLDGANSVTTEINEKLHVHPDTKWFVCVMLAVTAHGQNYVLVRVLIGIVSIYLVYGNKIMACTVPQQCETIQLGRSPSWWTSALVANIQALIQTCHPWLPYRDSAVRTFEIWSNCTTEKSKLENTVDIFYMEVLGFGGYACSARSTKKSHLDGFEYSMSSTVRTIEYRPIQWLHRQSTSN